MLALAAAAVIALGGALAARARFGTDAPAVRDRLQRGIQHQFDDMAARLRAATASVARDGALVARAAADRDALPELFARLETARQPAAPPLALTVYVPDGAGGQRLLAWSDGGAEDLDARSLMLAGARDPVTTVMAGAMGLRLVVLAPITVRDDGADRLVGVVAAERLVTDSGRGRIGPDGYRLATPQGDVSILPADARPALPGATPPHLRVVSADGSPLVDVTYAPDTVEAARLAFQGRVAALALVPLVVVTLAAVARGALRRRHRAGAATFLGWSIVLALALLFGALALRALARLADAPSAAEDLLLSLAAMGMAAALPVAIWWRGATRRFLRSHPLRGPLELLGGGTLATIILAAAGLVIDRQLQEARLDPLASTLFPGDPDALAAQLVRLFVALAAIWSATTIHARLMERWRVHWYTPGPAALAVALATLPVAALSLSVAWLPALATVAPITIGTAVASALAALAAVPLRRRYRRASQSTRLLLLFGATVLPALIIDPTISLSARRATETAIETVHAPATLGHAEHLRHQLTAAMAEIDGMGTLASMVERPAADTGVSTDVAFQVWSQTVLSRARLTSAVELYAGDGTLTSRFALNVPEYGIDQSSVDIGCDWEVYGEASRFGAEELRMLHAERGVCDDTGTVRGAIVLHVIFDYRALPYLSARNPYDDLLRAGETASAAVPRGIQTVVYGWSRLPLFVSGPGAWALDMPLLERIERSRLPFWITRRTEAGTFRVHFLNDRAGIYAIGYPVPSRFDHLSRLSETVAIAALVFLLLLAGATVVTPLTRRTQAPLRALVQEVRTSFYRKLFLFFVFTAVVPVLVLALAFSAYMGDQLRSDVETEAVNAVTVARRVLEDTIALQQVPVTDDVMVWIGRVINQDVNVYDGGRLRATSQRDLFDAGVLAERTPAGAFRAVVLDRVPAFVEDQQVGPFTYLVAAAPVPGLGRQALLSVPLAPRQQEIEREISDLNRGVLFGAVCVMLLAAGLGAWVAQRVADPVARLTRATRQIASGRLDVRIVADTADELRRLVSDFNTMAATLRDQRAELGRAHELKAWADMSRQVAHDIKNPLTPIQLAAEHLQHVHEDQGRPLGTVFDQCIGTILRQVRLLRQIASEFSTFAASPTPTLVDIPVADLLHDVVRPYRAGLDARIPIAIEVGPEVPPLRADRTLLARALTNLVENALQAMPVGGELRLTATSGNALVTITVSDTGVGMTPEALARAFEPHFSTKTGGTGLGLANAKRNIEACGGTIAADAAPGRGTTMTVRLPAAGAAPGTAPAPAR